MTRTTKPLLALTAFDLMSRNVISIPQEMPLRAAADLLFQNQIGGGPVVDTDGRCIGMLCATDFMHRAKDGDHGAEDVLLPACPYQVKGQLLTGEQAVICTNAEGNCPLQEMRPTTGGRHTAVCQLRQTVITSDWQEVTRSLPVNAVRHYMTPEVTTVEPQTPLPELVRTMIDAHIHRVIVVDRLRRPIGIVSSTDILAALASACVDSIPNGKPGSEEAIRLCAYQKWEAAGKPGGDGVNFWLQAEREISKAE